MRIITGKSGMNHFWTHALPETPMQILSSFPPFSERIFSSLEDEIYPGNA
ncbi:MAG TPA: hypothetical protein PK069_09180 [Methanolinea sp.]|nr:hypothetical protein [Methanolinea sp.]HQK56513.1 hypothetical protein [Methanolinea sp.]